jgi:hypothetical protein
MAIKETAHVQEHTSCDDDTRERNRREVIEYFEKQHAELKIVKTTTSPAGQVIDWIPIESQGIIASPPPKGPDQPQHPDDCEDRNFNDDLIIADLECEGAELGPEGTVPIPRMDLSIITGDNTLAEFLSKSLPNPRERPLVELEDGTRTPTPDGANHLYANAWQYLKCYGGQGQYSCFDPAVEASNSESLIQTGLLNEQGKAMQAVEVGWQVLPSRYGDSQPHLFTYFRTAGGATGPRIGGYNRDTGDWNQVDGTIFPKSTFAPLSVPGDPNGQRRIEIATQLYQGNWWVWCQGRWIGYYSASLFQAAAPDSQDTLASYADKIGYWGEIADDTSITTPTKTDMGSGQFPERAWPWSAYIHNLAYSPDESGLSAFFFDASGGTWVTNPDWYRIVPHYTIDTTWGSFVWLGGPGAG